MTPFTLSITESQTLAQLRAFLLSVLPPGAEVFKGQANQVPEPKSNNFIVLTPNMRSRLATTIYDWNKSDPNASTMQAKESTEVDVQLDIHGELSTDWGQLIQTLFRSPYCTGFMAGSGVQPLYCDDGHQVPFINGEGKYEDRWILTTVLQVSPVISTPQEFADTLVIGVIEVEATYPADSLAFEGDDREVVSFEGDDGELVNFMGS